ncbi:MAG TPA: hypothetical protein VIR32_06950 [Lachnospiraceae bacterium]
MLCKMLLWDFKNGIKNRLYCLYFPLVIAGITFTIGYYNIVKVEKMPNLLSFGNLYVFIYGGMVEYIPAPGNYFIFPGLWLIMMLIPAYMVLSYPIKDFVGMGKMILVQGQTRTLWWISKCVWNVVMTVLFHGIVSITIFLLTFFITGRISFQVDGKLQGILFSLPLDREPIEDIELSFALIVLPLLYSVAINLLEMLLAFYLKQTFSFLSILILSLIGAYLYHPFMISNYAMLIRNKVIHPTGMESRLGYCILVILVLLVVVIGQRYLSKKDIMEKET